MPKIDQVCRQTRLVRWHLERVSGRVLEEHGRQATEGRQPVDGDREVGGDAPAFLAPGQNPQGAAAQGWADTLRRRDLLVPFAGSRSGRRDKGNQRVESVEVQKRGGGVALH